MVSRRILNIIWFFSVWLISVPCAFSQGFYADVLFDIGPDGKVDISGTTNHPEISPLSGSDDFTLKNKRYWSVNISAEGSFESYIAKVRLPPEASLNYLRASNVLSIGEDDGRIAVAITGRDEPLSFFAQYSLKEEEGYSFLPYLLVLPILVVPGILIFVYLRKRRGISRLSFSSLTDRQAVIVRTVMNNKGSMAQSELEKCLGIPKASLSRNIESLVRKNMIVREPKGMTNQITLKPKKEEK
jgi:uncharacterized membrane protein